MTRHMSFIFTFKNRKLHLQFVMQFKKNDGNIAIYIAVFIYVIEHLTFYFKRDSNYNVMPTTLRVVRNFQYIKKKSYAHSS
jgi:hypothetical protein